MAESALLTGTLEPTNEPYAIAKIAGIKLCESYNRQYGTDFRSVMPTNLYGPGDNFDLENSHVIPALIRKFHDAKVSGADAVEVWGTGTPRREFLHVDDMADACFYVMGLDREIYRPIPSPCYPTSMWASARTLVSGVGRHHPRCRPISGRDPLHASKPDGAPRKLLDVSRLRTMGWHARTDLAMGCNRLTTGSSPIRHNFEPDANLHRLPPDFTNRSRRSS